MTTQLMTVGELSKYIHLNMMAILRLAREGKIPAVEVLDEWRFEKKAIDKWLGERLANGRVGEEPITEVADRPVLVVDDDKIICDLFMRLLGQKGYQVAVAHNGQKALQIAREKRPSLVFLDIRMPGMNGIDTLRVLKRIDRDIQVVMITAYAAVDTAVEAMRFGALDYIRKPFDKDKLEQLVRQGMQKREETR